MPILGIIIKYNINGLKLLEEIKEVIESIDEISDKVFERLDEGLKQDIESSLIIIYNEFEVSYKYLNNLIKVYNILVKYWEELDGNAGRDKQIL
jgi:hypothetical protein